MWVDGEGGVGGVEWLCVSFDGQAFPAGLIPISCSRVPGSENVNRVGDCLARHC